MTTTRYFICAILLLVLTNNLFAQSEKLLTVNNLILNGEYSSAINELHNIIEKDSTDIDALKKLAYCFSSLNNYEKAIVVLLKAINLNENNYQLYLPLGDNYAAVDQYPDAKEAYKTYLQLNENDNNALLKTGKVCIALKQWKEAKDLFQRLIEHSDSTSSYFEQLAICNESLKEYEAAIINLHIAHRLNPKNIKVMLRLSSIYFKTERPLAALKVAEAGLKFYPEMSDFWLIKAEAFFKLENFKDAAFNYKNALAFGDSSANVYRNLGVCLYTQDKIDSSISFLDTAFIKNNKDIVTALYLGVAYKDMQNIDSSLKYLQKVLDIQNNNYVVETYVHLAAIYYDKNDYQKSIEFYNTALKLEPERKSILFNLASTYDKAYADKKIALKYFQEFVSDSGNIDKLMFDYSTERIREIKERLHFTNPQ